MTATRAKPRRKSPARAKESLASKTTLPRPGDTVSWVWMPRKSGGVWVTEQTALTIGAVWACVRVIAEAGAVPPWHVFARTAAGRQPLPNHPVDTLLNSAPNPETPPFVWRETMLANCAVWGNSYSEIERDSAGRPIGLWQITPDRVTPTRSTDGQIIYVIRNHGAPDSVILAENMFHLKGLGYDGLLGYSVIGMHARTLGIAMATDDFTSDYFSNDSTPGGLLKHKGRLGDAARTNLITSWEKRHKGKANQRKVAVLEEGMEWQQIGIPPQDSQLIEARQFSVTEIARIFKVPPHKIADLTRSTFSNIESEEIAFVVDSLMPWCVRLEQEANTKLFSPAERGRIVTKLNLNARLRADSAARGSYYQIMLDRGVFSINDVRQLEDMNPVGDGDARFVPLNMQLLETAANPPEPPPPAAAAPPEPAPDPSPSASEANGAARAALVRAEQDVWRDALARILRKEVKAARHAAAKPDAFLAWMDSFYVTLENDFRAALLPAARLRAALSGGDAAELATQAAAAHCAQSRAALLDVAGASKPAELAAGVATCVGRWERERP